MRHLKETKKFHRKKGQRQALFKGLLNNVIIHEKIETSEAKAKALKPRVEKLVTLGKKQTLASLRILNSRLPKKAAMKVYYEIAPRYKDRKGGYMRIVKVAKRQLADGSKKAIIEFV